MNSIAEIERELAELRTASMDLRTSAMTHLAWAPPEWQDAARDTLAGLAERHPSRTLLLFPQADEQDLLDADVSLSCFSLPELERHVCTEVIELRLHGERAKAPASVVMPLVLPDLPVFLRWRGCPPFGDASFEQLVDVVDRLVVDSREWPDPAASYPRLVPYFERVAVSDISWTRTLRWRRALAQRWPFEPRELHVVGPADEAHLLCGWLESRLGVRVRLRHEDAKAVVHVAVDGAEVTARSDRLDPSDLLSEQLERFSRDDAYEASVAAVGLRA